MVAKIGSNEFCMNGLINNTNPSSRKPFQANWPLRLGGLALLIYVAWASAQLDITWARFSSGLTQAAKFFDRLFPPNFAAEKAEMIVAGLTESIQIAVVATALGIALALPIGILAARNLMPAWVAWPARALIAVCRSFHEVVVAIIFVKAVGFGAVAGVGALVVGAIGFIAKLFAEAIEEISPKQVEAVRASGAGFFSVLAYGVLPQVMSRFLGFASYQFDANLRASTMIGIVGAGGIGVSLMSAFQRFDYDFVCAILISIILLVVVAEVISGFARSLFSGNLARLNYFRRGQFDHQTSHQSLAKNDASINVNAAS